MKKNNFTKHLLWTLAFLTIITASIHLLVRKDIPEGSLLVEYQDQQIYVSLSQLPQTDVRGSLVNGKGETRQIDSAGCTLLELLETVAVETGDIQKVTVTAADEYSAVVTAEEFLNPEQVYLLLEDGIELVVFGDSNSKRNVRNVERVLIE